jgi:hypothetical protein
VPYKPPRVVELAGVVEPAPVPVPLVVSKPAIPVLPVPVPVDEPVVEPVSELPESL